ncbi:MAG TPA: GntR family transcriptional regulator [Gaiellaceae bacterium]|nr:GntR family transcriptional regulator [Gaiellaceae bacterium]
MATTDRRRPRTLAERALADLQEAILHGEIAPGTPLRLEKLARTLEMSPMPVREAVRQLEALGLAEHVPHRGARVSRLSVDDLRDTYEARLALETLAVRRAAARFTEEDAAAAHRRIDEHVRAYRAGDLRAGREAHAAFHLGLYDASGSRWLPRLIRPLWENSERYRIASLHASGSLQRRTREHQRIVEACAAHDADAADEALRSHLVLTANLVARWLGEDDLFPGEAAPG